MRFEISWALMKMLMKKPNFFMSHEQAYFAHEIFQFSWALMKTAHEKPILSYLMSKLILLMKVFNSHERSWKCSYKSRLSWAVSWAYLVKICSWAMRAFMNYMSCSWAAHEQMLLMSKTITLGLNWCSPRTNQGLYDYATRTPFPLKVRLRP